jgi:hypothetical protein
VKLRLKNPAFCTSICLVLYCLPGNSLYQNMMWLQTVTKGSLSFTGQRNRYRSAYINCSWSTWKKFSKYLLPSLPQCHFSSDFLDRNNFIATKRSYKNHIAWLMLHETFNCKVWICQEPLNRHILVGTLEELFQRKGNGSGLGNREHGRRDPLCWPRGTPISKKLALTSPTSGGSSVGTAHSRTQGTEFSFLIIKEANRVVYEWITSQVAESLWIRIWPPHYEFSLNAGYGNLLLQACVASECSQDWLQRRNCQIFFTKCAHMLPGKASNYVSLGDQPTTGKPLLSSLPKN